MGNNQQLDRFFLQRMIPYVDPFYSIDIANNDEVLKWFRDTDAKMASYYEPLFREQKNNLRIYMNTGFNPNYFSPLVAAYIVQGLTDDAADDIDVNECFRMVMEQVSLIVSGELVPQVLPTNDDYADKIAAKITKEWLTSISYDLDIDLQRIKWEIQKFIFGESFVFPVWDEERGELLPDAKKYKDEDLPYLDENGHPMMDEMGIPFTIRKYLRQGDIDLKNPLPFEVMIDPKPRFIDSNWSYYVEWLETAYLKKKYPKIKFKDKTEGQRYDSSTDSIKGTPDHTKVYNFYHRSHPFLPEGQFIRCTEDSILVKKTFEDNPSLLENPILPMVRFLDLDVGIGCRGAPIMFRNIRNVVSGYNRLTNQIYKNLQAESPKLLIHESAAVDAQRMPTGVIAMEWRGNHEPKWVIPNTNTNSIFQFRSDLKTNIIEMGMSTSIVRGQTPNAQLDSFIALQHFEDQRRELAGPAIKMHVKSMEHLYRLIISIARDNYDEDDNRMIKIVGKGDRYMLKFFNPQNLEKNYDISITTTGNLANSKAARTQMMITIMEKFPGIIEKQQFVDNLGLGNSEKFVNIITSATNSAEAENEEMLSGTAPLPPARFEDLIAHWDAHRIPLQGQEFKNSPPHIKNLFERHVTATEKLMFEQATESPMFAARLAELKQFPMYYTPKPTNEPPPEAMMGGDLGGVPEQQQAIPADMESPPFNEGGPPPPADEGVVENEANLAPV